MKTKKVLLLAVALVAAATHVSRAQPVPDVAWWDFSRVTNNVVFDATGNGHHAGVEGPRIVPEISPQSEIGLWAIDFDGMNWLRVADGDALDLVGNWTVAFWARPGQLFNGVENWLYKVAGYHDTEGGWALVLQQRLSGSNNVAAVTYGSPNRVAYAGEIQLEQWNHVAVTYDATTYQVTTFVNGVRAGSGILGPMLPNVYPLIMGADLLPDGVSINPEYRSQGSMADIRIYSRILSDAEVGMFCPPVTCAQQLGKALAALASLQAANAALATDLLDCRTALAAERADFQQFKRIIDAGLKHISCSLNPHDRDFVIPGATTQEKFRNLVDAVVQSSQGVRRQLYKLLAPRKRSAERVD